MPTQQYGLQYNAGTIRVSLRSGLLQYFFARLQSVLWLTGLPFKAFIYGTTKGSNQAHGVNQSLESSPPTSFTLLNILQALRKQANVGANGPDYVHIFVDKLHLTSVDISVYPRIRWLRIFAHTITVPSSSDLDTTIIDLPQVWLCTIFAANIPDDVVLRLGAPKRAVALVSDPSPAVGVHYWSVAPPSMDDPPVQLISAASSVELHRPNASDYADSKFKRHHMVARMLTEIFDAATRDDKFWLGARAGELPQDCIAAFKLVTMLTKACEDQAELYAQADTLLHRLRIPARASYFAPSRSPALAAEVLDHRMKAATSVDSDFKSLKLEDLIATTGENITAKLSNDVFKAAGGIVELVTNLAQTSAAFEFEKARTTYQEKLQAADKAMQRFDALKDEVERTANNWNEEFKTWKRELEEKQKWDDAMLCFELIVDVGLIFYSGPSALINSTEKLTKAAKKMAKTERLLKGKDRWKRIGELASKLDKVHSVIGTIKEYGDKYFEPSKQSTTHGSEDVKTWVRRITDAMHNIDQGTDWGELKAMWDDFEIDNELAFKEDLDTLDPKVKGTQEYHAALQKFVARGRDLVAAQKDTQDFRKKMREAMAYQKLLEVKKQEYGSPEVAKKSGSRAPTMKVTKALLELDLRTTKRWLFLAIHNWVLAASYMNGMAWLPNTNGQRPVITESLSSLLTSIAKFKDEIAKETITSWQEADGAHLPLLTVTTDDVSVFAKNWRTFLKDLQEISFCIPVESEFGKPLSYVKSANVTIEGLQPVRSTGEALAQREAETTSSDAVTTATSPHMVSFEIEFGPTLTQRVARKKAMSFFTDAQARQCEYNLATHKVEADAVWQSMATADSRQSAMRPCLFSNGILRLQPPETEGFSWNVSDVTRITLTLSYEFSLPVKKTESS